MPLPFAAAAALMSGATGLGCVLTGAANIAGDGRYEKFNKQKAEDLYAKERTGDLGLSGEQKQLATQQMMQPVQNAAAAGQKRAEQIMAAGGQGNGADLARLRQENAQTVSQGGQNAMAQLAGMDLQAQEAQKQELEQRLQPKDQMRLRDYNIAGDMFSQASGAIGKLAGAPPGTTQAAGMFGAPAAGAPQSYSVGQPQMAPAQQLQSAFASFPPEQQAAFAAFAQRNPEAFKQIVAQAMASSQPGSSSGAAAGQAAMLAALAGV
jgi:hypothetical protein